MQDASLPSAASPWTAAAELTDTRAPKLTVSQCAERAGSMFAHPDPFWFILSSD